MKIINRGAQERWIPLPKWTATAKMYKDFIGGYLRFRGDLKKMDKWMDKYAEHKGFRVNPHPMYLTNLKIWIAENQTMYGKRICPCFEATGDSQVDRKLICPCSFAEDDIAKTGTCHCKLFARGDFTDADFIAAEKDLMKEYRIALNLQGNVLDTRGVPQSENRQMDVPDPLHQIKQALNQVSSMPLKVIVEREQSAKNILEYAKLKGIQAVYQPYGEAFQVTIRK